MKLSIVIPIYKQINYTLSCLKDLSQLNDCEIIVVDNCCQDTQDKLKAFNIKYIISDFNSYSHACNLGYQNSIGDNVVFMNNDIRVKHNHSNCFDDLLKTIENNEFCLVGPAGGFLDKNYNFVYETKDQDKEINYISGWCVGASRNTLQNLEIKNNIVFDEDFIFYFEDTELSFRAKNKGARLILCDLPIVHFGKISTDKNKISKLYINGRQTFLKKVKK